MHVISGFILLFVYSVLIIQLIYFLICNICYLYHNPQYRVLSAAFCIKQEITTTNVEITREATNTSSSHTISGSTLTLTDLSSSRPSILSAHTRLTNERRTQFIHHGLETLSHCILMPLYLICLLIVVCVRIKMCYVTFKTMWSEYRVFCSYAPNLFSLGVIAHRCSLIIMCIPALRIQYMYNTTKCHRLLPIVSIICTIISAVIGVFHTTLIIYEVKEYEGVITCIDSGGIGVSQFVQNCHTVAYYISFVLCFSTVIIPIYAQRQMLINLPENSENKPVLRKINALSKRMSVSAVVIITMFVIINFLYRIFPVRPSWLSPVMWSLYVEGYVMIALIYKDWRMRLWPLCKYNYINVSICRTQPIHDNQMDIELAPVSQDSSVGLPNMVRDVSKEEIRDNTFSI